jgi:hypothetical protein
MQNQLSGILDKMQDALVIIDYKEQKVKYSNESARKIFGMDDLLITGDPLTKDHLEKYIFLSADVN